MQHLTLSFTDDDATLERIHAKAQEHGMTAEQWAHRVIARELGDYMLRELPEGARRSSLVELFTAVGVLKPRP